jgi:hypothetical protein
MIILLCYIRLQAQEVRPPSKETHEFPHTSNRYTIQQHHYFKTHKPPAKSHTPTLSLSIYLTINNTPFPIHPVHPPLNSHALRSPLTPLEILNRCRSSMYLFHSSNPRRKNALRMVSFTNISQHVPACSCAAIPCASTMR